MKTQNLTQTASSLAVFLFLTSTATMADRSTAVTVMNNANNPVPVEVLNDNSNNADQRQLIGISTQTLPAIAGIVLLNDACNADSPEAECVRPKKLTTQCQ